MKKIKTLKKNYEFKNVLSKGKFFVGKYVTIYIKNNKKNENYVGIAVGTKVAKAVKRNRIKRLIRENYKNLEEKINSGNTVVFLWKKKIDIKNANYKNIKQDMEDIFNKSKLFIEEKK